MDIAIYHDQIANIFNLTMAMPIFHHNRKSFVL